MKFIPQAATRAAGLAVLRAQKNSPTILFAVGVAGVVGTVVLACRATLKVDEVLDHMEKDKAQLDDMRHLDEESHNKDIAFFYARSGLEIAKLYAPAAALGIVSIGCLGGSHHILSKRNVALTAAYATVDKAFKEYRERVEADLGPGADKIYMHDSEMVSEKVVGEDGKTKTVKHQVVKGASMYARFFDESSPRWSRIHNQNQFFINCQQSYANDMLRNRGFIFLNEVYRSLGIPESPAGQVVGWVMGHGDGYVDFGIGKGDSFMAGEFVNGNERSILLDFNVDGVVYDLLEG